MICGDDIYTAVKI